MKINNIVSSLVWALALIVFSSLTACTTHPKYGTYGNPLVPTYGEIAVKEGFPLIVKLTPYKPAGLSDYVIGGRGGRSLGQPPSEEERMTGGGVRYSHVPVNGVSFGEYILDPFVPMGPFQFMKYVQDYATMFHAESVKYDRYGDEAVFATTATVVGVKNGLLKRNGITDEFFVQILINGQPCGVWVVEPK